DRGNPGGSGGERADLPAAGRPGQGGQRALDPRRRDAGTSAPAPSRPAAVSERGPAAQWAPDGRALGPGLPGGPDPRGPAARGRSGVTVLPDPAAVARAGADAVAGAIRDGLRTLAVSGGRTPRELFELLAAIELQWG